MELNLPEFDVIDEKTNSDNDYIITLVPNKKEWECPVCGSIHTHIHKENTREVRDLSIQNHRVGLVIKGHRRRCSECRTTFAEEYESIEKSSRLTNRLRDEIKRQSIIKPFRELADEYGISTPTVERIFNDYAKELEEGYQPVAPDVLGIDEVHLKKEFRGVFVDVPNRKVLEMTPNRSKKTVKAMIMSLPDKENITCVTMDMWKPYREAVYETLPGVPVVVDRFHVIKELHKELEAVRRQLRAEVRKKGKNENNKIDEKSQEESVSLKNMRYLLLTGSENLSKKQNDMLQEMLKAYPQFETPYLLKEAFRSIYDCETKEEAEKQYKEWVEENKANNMDCYEGMMDMVDNWHTEIFNFFDQRCTNATTESLNNVIREVDRQARGYSFEVLRIKMIHRGEIEKKGKFKFE